MKSVGFLGRCLKDFAVFSTIFLMGLCLGAAAGAQGRDFFSICAEGTLAEVQAAVCAGADLNAKRYPDEASPLVSALENPDPGVLKLLLNAKKGGWDKDSLGEALYEACSSSRHTLVKPNAAKVRLLIEAGADVNTRGKMNWTPLFASLFYIFDGEEEPVDPEVVRLLLEAGANVNVVDDKGESPLFWAVSGEDAYNSSRNAKAAKVTGQIKEMLLAAGAQGMETMQGKPLSSQEQALIAACGHGDVKEVLRLIAAGVDVNASDPIHKTTPILSVAGHYNEEYEGPTDDFDFEYPEDPLLIRALARAGANLDAQDRQGKTILHWAMEPTCRTSPVVQALLESGADPNVRNANGKTPLAVLRIVMETMRKDFQANGMDQNHFKKGLAEKTRIEKLLLKAGGRE